MDNFFEGLNILIQYFLFMRWWFSRSFKGFSLPYTSINFLFTSLKLLTNFEIAYVQKIHIYHNKPSKKLFISRHSPFNGLLYQAVLLPPPPYYDRDVEAEEEGQRHTWQ